MQTLSGKNMAPLIPPWATTAPPYAYDATPTHCYPCTYDALCDYDDTRRANSRTSSTAVTTAFHWETGFADHVAIFEDPAGGHEQDTADHGMSLYGYRYYKPDLGRWVSRDPIGERGGVNLYSFVENSPIRRIDPAGRYSFGGTTDLTPSEYGVTKFKPKITVQSVTVNGCCCSVNAATWSVDTQYFLPNDLNNHPIYTQSLVDQVVEHEVAHASTDDQLAQKALLVAISYMKSHCHQKSFFGALFGGGWNWTTADCKAAMDDEAEHVVNYLINLAYGTLQTQAHSLYGASPMQWNPAGVPQWHSWFDNWLAGQFNGGKFW